MCQAGSRGQGEYENEIILKSWTSGYFLFKDESVKKKKCLQGLNLAFYALYNFLLANSPWLCPTKCGLANSKPSVTCLRKYSISPSKKQGYRVGGDISLTVWSLKNKSPRWIISQSKQFAVVCSIQSTWTIPVIPRRKHSSWNGALCFMDCVLMTDDISSDTSEDDL